MIPETPVPEERRRRPRFPWSVSLRYASFETDEETQRAIRMADTVDVSSAGVQLASREPIRTGAFLQVAVRLPDRTAPVILLGKTRWCREEESGGHRTGVEFLGHVDQAFVDAVDRVGAQPA